MRHARSRLARGALIALGVLLIAALLVVRLDMDPADLTAKYGPPPSRFIEIEGMRVHYRDEGQGPPLVLIHGSASSLHTWDGWVTEIGARRRIVRLDLPGFGLTGPAPDRDYTAARYARVVAGLMDRLGVAQADVAGNSLGGRVALTLALEHPARVRRLVLVDAAGLSGQKPPTIFALARTPVVNGLLTLATPRFVIRRNVEQVYGDPGRISDALVDRYYELTRRAGNRRAFVDRMTGPPDPDLDGRLGEIKVPVLLVWGERDRWIPPPFAERMRRGIAGSKLVTIPDAGHVPMEETPAASAREAERFLADGAS